jgi:hypothetical protein
MLVILELSASSDAFDRCYHVHRVLAVEWRFPRVVAVIGITTRNLNASAKRKLEIDDYLNQINIVASFT